MGRRKAEQRRYYWASDMYCIVQRGDLGCVSKVLGRRLLKKSAQSIIKTDDTSSQLCLLQVLFSFAGCPLVIAHGSTGEIKVEDGSSSHQCVGSMDFHLRTPSPEYYFT